MSEQSGRKVKDGIYLESRRRYGMGGYYYSSGKLHRSPPRIIARAAICERCEDLITITVDNSMFCFKHPTCLECIAKDAEQKLNAIKQLLANLGSREDTKNE